MAIQTRGQITLIATPDYRLQVSPQVITIPVNEDDSLLGGGSFSQEITINALDSLNNNLKFESVVFKNEKLTSDDGGYNWKYNWVPDLKNLANSGQLVFDVKLENNSDSAEDDYNDTVEVGWVKAKSGRDGTPAYGVNLWAKDQVFIKSLDDSGNYVFEPNEIVLTTTLINCEKLEGVSYKWFKDENKNPIQTGGTTYEVEGNNSASGMYRVEVYNSEDILIASDILGLGIATSGSEAFTVLLTNDSETVSTDRDKLSINGGTVSTGILVYKGAIELTPDKYSVSLETEGDENDSDPGEEIINNISFSYENGLITGSYDPNQAIDARLKIVITVGQAEFIKYFYVKSSLAGESAKMIKVTGPQFFTVLANGDIYPESIELIANPQNVKFEKWTYFEGNSEIDIEDPDKYLTIEKNSSFWGDKKILRIRAYSENKEYYDEYPIYKIDDGKNSYSIIPSNETINIVTDVFGLPVENKRTYRVSFKVFSGNEEANYNIKEDVIIFPSNMSSFISVVKENSSTFKIIVERNEEMSYEFLTTQIDFTFTITIAGIEKSITKSIYLQPAQQGADAKRMSLSGPQVFRYNNASDGTINYNPTSTTIICQTNINNYAWSYKVGDDTYTPIGNKNTSLTINPKTNIIGNQSINNWESDKILTVKAYETEENNGEENSIAEKQGGIFDEITIYKVRDGSDGSDSIFVYPLNPSIIFTESSETGKLIKQTITCQIASFVGIDNKLPEDLSISNSNTDYYTAFYDNKTGIISITTKTDKNVPTNETERVGEIQCSATLKDTKNNPHFFNFSIKWTIIKGGVDGNGIEEIINYYYASTSNNIDDILKIEQSAWTKNAIPSNYNTTNKYLWNYEYINYSKIDDKSSNPFIIGVYGEEGKSVIGFEEYFYANNSSDKSNVPFPPNGSTIENIWFSDINQTSYSETIPYLWVAERAILDDNKTFGEWVGPRLAGVWGKTGEEGKPATNSVVLLLYRRSANTLINNDKPGTLYYTFSTGSLTGSFNSWSEEIPTGTNPCYVIQYKAVSSENDTVTISGPSWSTPKIFVQNGTDISRKIKNTIVFYKSITAINGEFTTPTKPTSATQNNGKWVISGWITELPSIGAATGYQIWSCNLIIYNDDTYTITEPEINPGAYADSLANQIYNGNIGIQILGTTITKAVLNNSEGLFIKNSSGFSLKADGSSLGFYYNDDLRIGMYDFPNLDGSITTGMLIKGGIYADRGKIGTLEEGGTGWTILGSNSNNGIAAIHSGDRSSLASTSDGVYIGTDGLSFGKKGKTSLSYDLNTDVLDIKGHIIAETLKLTNALEMSDISGFDVDGLRNYLGFYSGSSTTEVANIAQNGDLFIYYADGNNTTNEISVSATFTPSPTYTNAAMDTDDTTIYHGKSLVWNSVNHSGSNTDNIDSKYMKVGYATRSYRNNGARFSTIFTLTNATSITNFKINFSGILKPSGAANDPYTNHVQPTGSIDVFLYDSASSTVPIATGSIPIAGLDLTTSYTFTSTLNCSGSNSISSGQTYYLVFTGGEKRMIYMEYKTLTIASSGVSTTTPAGISIRSNGKWVSIAGSSVGGYEDTNTTYTLSLNGTNLILSGSDNSTSSIPLPTGTTYIQGNGINIDSNSNTISISSNAGLYSYNNSNYGNKIIFRTSAPTTSTSGSLGDICFVYEV